MISSDFPEGAEYVLEGYEHIDTNRFKTRKMNLRTPVVRAIHKAGLLQWPRVLQNLRSTCETELNDEHPLHVVVYWMNNLVRIAQKHYLQITDDHLKAGCGLAVPDQFGANEGAEPSLIAPHAPSAKTQTLQKKAFPVIDRHDPSQEIPKWAMRDSIDSKATQVDQRVVSTALCRSGAPKQTYRDLKLLR